MSQNYLLALEASEARFREIIEKNADAMIVVGFDGRVVFANPAAVSLMGAGNEQLVGQLFGVPVVPGERTEVDVPRGDGPCRIAEMRVVSTVWQGMPAYLASLRDISDRRRAEDALAFLAEASRVLADSLDRTTTVTRLAQLAVAHLAEWCAIDLLEEEGLHRVALAHAATDRHAQARELVGDRVVASELPDPLANLLRGGKPIVLAQVEDVFAHVFATGPRRRELLSAFGCRSLMCVPLVARGVTLGVLTLAASARRRYDTSDLALAQDLAGRAALALKNARLYDESIDAIRQREEFLAMLAHELRNPLAAIRNATRLLEHNAARPDMRAQALGVIERQSDHTARLLDDLLDLSRVTRGKIELRRERLDLARTMADAVQSLRPTAEWAGMRLSLEPTEGPIWVEADPTRLEQVFSNLLTNAIRYSEPGGLIECFARREDGVGVAGVRDHGIGIPPQELGRIFELFAQGDRALDRSRGGLGIGLTLAKALVEMHQGAITAFSRGAGQGSEFTVRLPLSTEAKSEARAEDVTATRSGLRVLLVEDHADSRRMLAELLALEGHDVRTAEDGPSGLSALADDRPDIALVDIGLPGLDGYELARRARRQPNGEGLFLVALTGYGQAEDHRRALETGFDAHLVKPVQWDELTGLLARIDARTATADAG